MKHSTAFGVRCPGCKTSEGGRAAPEPYPTLKVWPPIVHSEFLVTGYNDWLQSRFILADALGRVLIDQAVPPNTDHFVVPTTGLPSGFYIARLTAGNEIEQARIVVSH